jgi:hypothetical protein
MFPTLFSFANSDCEQARPAEVCFGHFCQMIIMSDAGIDASRHGVATTAFANVALCYQKKPTYGQRLQAHVR